MCAGAVHLPVLFKYFHLEHNKIDILSIATCECMCRDSPYCFLFTLHFRNGFALSSPVGLVWAAVCKWNRSAASVKHLKWLVVDTTQRISSTQCIVKWTFKCSVVSFCSWNWTTFSCDGHCIADTIATINKWMFDLHSSIDVSAEWEKKPLISPIGAKRLTLFLRNINNH